MPEENSSPTITLQEAAKVAGVHQTTLTRWAKANNVPINKNEDHRKVIEVKDLTNILLKEGKLPLK